MNRIRRFALLQLIAFMVGFTGTAHAQPSAAPFLPMCQGDVTHWLRIETYGMSSIFAQPKLVSFTIELDTLIAGNQYYFQSFPTEMELPQGWMRSDSSGIYLRKNDTDSLIIPAFPSLGDSISGGVVSEILMVSTHFGETRGFSVHRESRLIGTRYTWTWAQNVGLWDLTSHGRGSATQFRFLSGRRCGIGPSLVPVALDLPLRNSDILVHRRSSSTQPSLGYQVQRTRVIPVGLRWTVSNAGFNEQHPNRTYQININAAGNVMYTPRDVIGTRPEVEYYPAYIPSTNVVNLGGREFRVAARFDTTMFSEPVKAFRLRAGTGSDEKVMTIADRFGVVYEKEHGIESTLHSAELDSISYNRTSEVRRWLPLCSGSIFEYRMIGPFMNDAGRMKLRDTTIDSTTYTNFTFPSMYIRGENVPMNALNGAFREVADTVFDEEAQIVLPYGVDLGDETSIGIVIAIEQREFFGMQRWMMATADIDEASKRSDTLVEGIGLYASTIDDSYKGRFSWTLTGGIVCGEAFGKVLGVDAEYPRSIGLNITAYPNPTLSGSGWIHVEIPGAVRGFAHIDVVDALGRVRHAREIQLPGSSTVVPLSISSLEPGMYMIVVASGQHRTWTRLMVR